MSGLRLASVFLAVGCLSPLAAQSTRFCIENRVRLESAGMVSFLREFKSLMPEWSESPCVEGAVRVAFRLDPPARFHQALGLTWHAGERLLPAVEVYLNPILRTLGRARSSEIVGRAMARVAAHEVAHYQTQRLDHDATGLLRAAFHATHLSETDPSPFLLAKNKGGVSNLTPP